MSQDRPDSNVVSLHAVDTPGSEHVITLLEELLQTAKEGGIRAIQYAVLTADADVQIGLGGEFRSRVEALGAASALSREVGQLLDNDEEG